jgi:predicted dienelactone hydrolase
VRSLELLLLVLVVLGGLRALTPWRDDAASALLLAAATLVVTVAHLVVEHPRWQLVALYVAVVGVTAGGLVTGIRSASPQPRRTFVATVLTLAGVAGILAWAVPVTQLDAPGGPAAVGTVSFAWTDPERVERYGTRPGSPRELVAQVWYPADDAAPAAPAPWVHEAQRFGAIAAEELDLPPFALGHLGLIRSHATEGAAGAPAAAPASRPLLVYSHGWRGFRAIHSTLLEELASHGYVVVALDHTHGSLATVFPDGRVTPLDPRALPDQASAEERDAAGERLVATYARDLETVIDQLDAGLPPEVYATVDLDRVGLLGHSTGGGAAILACARLPECGAVVGLDPWVEPLPDDLAGAGLEVPLLSLRSEEWVGGANDKRLRRLHAGTSAPQGLVAMAGVQHRDFTLLPMFSPLASRIGFSGTTPGAVTHRIVEDWTLRFFDHHLRGRGPDPLERPPQHGEATLEGTG